MKPPDRRGLWASPRVAYSLLALSTCGAAVIAACGSETFLQHGAIRTSEASASSYSLTSSATAPSSSAHQPSSPTLDLQSMPGPDRAREHEAAVENAKCAACHADVAAEWSASLHHTSDTEPAYRDSFAIEPLPFCRGCHAPEAVATREESTEARELGVSCVTCHVTDPGTVLAAPLPAGADAATEQRLAASSPHAITRDARFAEADACGGCHEFAFPGRENAPVSALLPTGNLMQSTIMEHAASPNRAKPCAECHMPKVAETDHPRRSHTFTTTRDVAIVKRAFHLSVGRVDATHVRVTITPTDVGHAFPTGDLFRRLKITAWADDGSRRTRFLARHFKANGAGMGRELVSDDRVTAPTTVDLELASAADLPIHWRVVYQRVAHPNGIDEEDATLAGELELDAGTALPDGEGLRR